MNENPKPCRHCGRAIKKRLTSAARMPHKCPHGRECVGGNLKRYLQGAPDCPYCRKAQRDGGKVSAQPVLFVRLPETIKRQLAAEAARRGISQNQLAIELLAEPLNQIEERKRC